MPIDFTRKAPTNAQEVADSMLLQAKNLFGHMSSAFNRGSKIFWQNPNGIPPNEIALALGDKGKELFEIHYALGQFIASIKPEAISEGMSVIGNFTMNEDGTVTVLSPTNT